MTEALNSLDPPLRVAQTRLKKRSQRPEIENCADEVYHYLVDEVKTISCCIKKMEEKKVEADTALRDIKTNIDRMESDLRTKKNSLLIDQQKCMSLRKTFPVLIGTSRNV